MNTIHIFGTRREFVVWATSVSPRKSGPDMRVVFGYDPVSWSLKAQITHETEKPSWAITQLLLPISAAEAKQTWASTQEDNLCLFFKLKMEFGSILAAARNGAWRSLDDRYLSFKKDAFSELTHDDAEKLVNDSKVWSALCGEVQMFGLTCRVLQQS